MSTIKLIIMAVVSVFVLVASWIFWPLRSIPPGHVGVLVLFGKMQEQSIPPGLVVVNPFAHVLEVDVRQYPYKVEGEVFTHDLQSIHGHVTVNYQVVPAQAAKLLSKFGREYWDIIIGPAAQDRMKGVTPHYNADEMVTKRAEVRDKMRASIIEAVNIRSEGTLLITDVIVNDLGFSKSFKTAIEEKQVAEQNAIKAERILTMMKVEADQVRAKAQGAADAMVMQSKAEAESFKLKSQQITPQMIQMAGIEKWDGVLPTYMSPGSALPFVTVK